MSESVTPTSPDFETTVNSYLARIRQIDNILKKPIESFLNAPHPQHRAGEPADGDVRLIYPSWISEAGGRADIADSEPDIDTQALCFMTFQRLRRSERRLVWLSPDQRKQLEDDKARLLAEISPGREDGRQEAEDGQEADETSYLGRLFSRTYGDLNPITASQVFRVRMEEGDGQAHCGMGLLSFFAMLWPLYRTYPDNTNRGARVEPSDPTAYVTAKCVIPLIMLQDLSERRKKLLSDIVDGIRRLRDIATHPHPMAYHRWQFTAALEELRDRLYSMQDVAISRQAFVTGELKIVGLLEDLTFGVSIAATMEEVLRILERVLEDVGARAEEILQNAWPVLDWIDRAILVPLSGDAGAETLQKLKIEAHPSLAAKERERERYLGDVTDAGRHAHALCNHLIVVLRQGKRVGRPFPANASPASRCGEVLVRFNKLARGNSLLADKFNEPIRLVARWCKTVVDREIAYASARNISDFDPAELVSGMAVAVRWDLMTTPMQIRDGVRRSLEGVWSDGSWRLGRPFFRRDALATWPPIADVLSTLASTIKLQPAVHDADEALFSFVDWLERTRRTLRMKEGESATGWTADRIREPARIHMGTTALAINVLLKVRGLVEHRLWEMCQKRFTVTTENKRLRDVFPVDLNRPHGRRLHSDLARMAKVDRSGQDGGVYSLVLHGPPGSSKTAISEALSEQMWHHAQRWGGREARLIRITPADFTRRGEGRLDSEARMIFNLLRHVRGATILFDEIDDLLLRRESGGGRRFMDLIVPAMLNRLQDLRSACPSQEICFVLGTNFVENIEPALLRKGRIDRMYPVVYPDWNTRLATIGKHFDPIIANQLTRGSPEDQDEFRRWSNGTVRRLARRTAGWPWLVINGLCGELARVVKGHDLTPAGRKKLKDPFATIYGREWNSLVEPAYVGRLLRHFDSPDLRNEYLLHLISRANHEEDRTQLLARADADAGEYIKAHFPERERKRQNEIWGREIIPKLSRSADTLLKRRSRSFFFDPDRAP
jgi:hypothetical protein